MDIFCLDEELEDLIDEDLIEERDEKRVKHRKSRRGRRLDKEKRLRSGFGHSLLEAYYDGDLWRDRWNDVGFPDYSKITNKKAFNNYWGILSSSRVLRKKQPYRKRRTGEKELIKKAYMEKDYDKLERLLDKDLACYKY